MGSDRESYKRALTQTDESGRSYAEAIADQIVEYAVLGDVRAVMVVLSQDETNLIRDAVKQLVKAEVCSKQQAAAALSLFLPVREL